MLHLFERPPQLRDWECGNVFAVPDISEALTTPISLELVRTWKEYAEENPPSTRIKRLGWDIRRICGDDDGIFIFVDLMAAWGGYETEAELDAMWDGFDRPRSYDDALIVEQLADLHSRDELRHLASTNPSLLPELEKLAARFDAISGEEFEEARKRTPVFTISKEKCECIRTYHQWDKAGKRYSKNLDRVMARSERVDRLDFTPLEQRFIDALWSRTQGAEKEYEIAREKYEETIRRQPEGAMQKSNVVQFPSPIAPPPGSVSMATPGSQTVSAPTIRSAADLRTKTFAPVRYLVPGYLAEGCTILAGRPKVGKSWFMLDVGLAVAGGGTVFGRKAEQGDVLYLGLEDNERRLRSRITKILGMFAEWPSRFHYATEWHRADQGGVHYVEEWIKGVPAPRLIVVDVLAKFRSPAGPKTAAYDADYAAIAGLQTLASRYNVAVVIVHHLRKSGSESGDPFEKISGTLGLSGAADSILILDKDANGCTLYGRGRDVEEIERAVTFDKESCRWQLLGEASEVRKSDERRAVIDALRTAGKPLSRTDLMAATGMTANNLDQLVFKMVQADEIERAGRGVYRLPGGEPMTPPPLPPPY
jgi:hypothetical protein